MQMSIFQVHNTGLVVAPAGDTFYEQWVSGTYIVAGVFRRFVDSLTVDEIRGHAPAWFDLLKRNKQARWPRGICGYYAIPIYTGGSFDQAVVEWVHKRPKYRYAVWHEPVLYDHVANAAETNMNWGLYGRAFRLFLFESILAALIGLHREHGHTDSPTLNGKAMEGLADPRMQTDAAKLWVAAMAETRRRESVSKDQCQPRPSRS